MRFFIQTLGCKINQYESQSLRESWTARGWSEADSPALATLVLVHTCAVTSGAVADSRGAVRRMGREAPEAAILVAGCAAQVEPEMFRPLPGVAAVVPQAAKPGLARWPEPCEAAPSRAWPEFSIGGFKRSRPVLKVQDGCSHGCTYCIVPRARGGARSRPFGPIQREAEALFAAGHREVVLSGINLGQFATEGGGDFWDMLAALERGLAPRWAGRARLRLSSLDPGMLGPKALDVLAGSSMTCPHLHLSMQSASASVLAAMGRAHYGAEEVLRFLDELRGVWPVAALGADLLTGFPGEDDAAFRQTLDFMARAGLSYAHVFPFSRRPGTVAAKAPGQLSLDVKKARAAALRAEAARLEEAFADRLASLPRLEVALEKADPPGGLCEYYVECRVENIPEGFEPPGLLAVRPLDEGEGGALRVEPLREPTEPLYAPGESR
ncbi:MiaB/RimO family radical SAM methylthiotransferase [Fundidesulfovibrio agrisoli]|uniref:MiaB/RimO family radical SAM methylthiotransferase n=1 Tax=Fundidesulfovibrio agrisoli TaxID=2922717 RepID=UPI001FACF063|nr:MiaB/RimO family radical SAM methylthiotransferase [Fundidesulfovibrio agrisoli]